MRHGVPVEFRIYINESYEGEISIGEEHKDWRWATRKEISVLSTMPYMLPFLKQLSSFQMDDTEILETFPQ
jgi:hypothetical protein